MKNYLSVLTLLLLITVPQVFSQSQVRYDDFPSASTTGMQLRYNLVGYKWNKLNITYYINPLNLPNMTQAQAVSLIQQAFAAWSNVSVLSFTQVASPSANITFSKGIVDSVQYGTMARTNLQGGNSIAYAEIIFDKEEDWTVDFSGFSLKAVAMHEIGHAVGIHHSDDENALMYYFYQSFASLTADDIAAIQTLYPAPFYYRS